METGQIVIEESGCAPDVVSVGEASQSILPGFEIAFQARAFFRLEFDCWPKEVLLRPQDRRLLR